MRDEIDITYGLDGEMKKCTEKCKIVIENENVFLEFKFKGSMPRQNQVALVDCIAKKIVNNDMLKDIFKNKLEIRILE